jgi:hypothetical protein
MTDEVKEIPEGLVEVGVTAEDWKALADAGYTANELQQLSKMELEGIILSVKGDEKEETELTADELAKIAAAGETEEQKAARLKAEQEAADAKALEDEAAAAGKTVEQLKAEKAAASAAPAAAPVIPEAGVITDDDLLDFVPVVTAAEIVFEFKTPADVQAKLDELEAKFDAGDIERAEYNKQRDEIRDGLSDKRQAAREAAREEVVWKKEQIFFLNARPEYMGEKQADGKYVHNLKSRSMLGALREAVSTLSAEPKNANMSGMELMVAADKAVKETFGMTKPAAAAAPAAAPASAPERKPPATRPDNVTLGAEIPAAAPNLTDGGFAELDKLSGEAYENALAKMPEAMRNRYLDDLRARR